MNKIEAIKYISNHDDWGVINYNLVEDLINKIYNNFEIEKEKAFHKGVKNGNESMKVAYNYKINNLLESLENWEDAFNDKEFYQNLLKDIKNLKE